ncbi:MAG: hypothetical protein OHK006_20690 [Thermodesulfovibrionales bacterium]
MDAAKIYGLCLERLKHQIRLAKQRREHGLQAGRIVLEGYNTADLEEIVDLLELYDMERTGPALAEKLEDLAFTASVLTREELSFGYDAKGHLCLYLVLPAGAEAPARLEMSCVA